MPGNAHTLAGRVVAVTGASRGIGRAIAELLHASGATVFAGARTLSDDFPRGITMLRLDVTDEDSVRAFADVAIAAGVDSLVNNAGVGVFGSIEEATVEEYHRIFDTNVLGMLLVTKHFIPAFKRRHAQGLTSSLVNITSDVSARTFAGGAIYTASKHAQRALTQSAAREGAGYGLRVTEIRPGMTDTYFNGGVPGSAEHATLLQASDVARAVLYALSTPTHLRVDEVVVHPVVQSVEF